MGRAPDETLQAHFAAIATGDPDRVVADFADDAVLLTTDGLVRGRDALHDAFAGIFGALPNVVVAAESVLVDGDVAFVTWTAEAEGGRVTDGVDTFVFDADGQIRAQTIRMTITPT